MLGFLLECLASGLGPHKVGAIETNLQRLQTGKRWWTGEVAIFKVPLGLAIVALVHTADGLMSNHHLLRSLRRTPSRPHL